MAQALSDAVSRAAGSLSNSSIPPPIINVEGEGFSVLKLSSLIYIAVRCRHIWDSLIQLTLMLKRDHLLQL